MAQWWERIAANPNDMDLIFTTHMTEWESLPSTPMVWQIHNTHSTDKQISDFKHRRNLPQILMWQGTNIIIYNPLGDKPYPNHHTLKSKDYDLTKEWRNMFLDWSLYFQELTTYREFPHFISQKQNVNRISSHVPGLRRHWSDFGYVI